jgi:hypothetical protein
MIEALITHLLRSGQLSVFDIQAMADDADAATADKLRAVYVNAVAQTQAEWQREQLQVINGGKL